MAVETLPVGANEDRAFAPFADSQVDGPGGARCKRDGHDFASLSQDGQRAVAALQLA